MNAEEVHKTLTDAGFKVPPPTQETERCIQEVRKWIESQKSGTIFRYSPFRELPAFQGFAENDLMFADSVLCDQNLFERVYQFFDSKGQLIKTVEKDGLDDIPPVLPHPNGGSVDSKSLKRFAASRVL